MGKETGFSLTIVRVTQDLLVSCMGKCVSHTNCDHIEYWKIKCLKKDVNTDSQGFPARNLSHFYLLLKVRNHLKIS